MQSLLVGQDSLQRSRWEARLANLGVSVTHAETEGDVLEAIGHRRFLLALCCWDKSQTVWDTSPAGVLSQIRSRSESTIAVLQRERADQIDRVLDTGFDDFLFEDCSEWELQAKLNHAFRIQTVSERLAQAQKLESIGELASGIAHEINTPIQYVGDNTRFVRSAYDDLISVLTACQSLLDLSGDNPDDFASATTNLRNAMDQADVEYLIEEIPSAIDQTLEGIDRVTNIVRAMKEFAHPGVSDLTLSDLAKSIENTVMVARNEWKYVADVETNFDPDLPPVPCLPGELNQVLLNLIVNASHAISDALADSPGTKGVITISTKLATPYAEIRVTDSGTGIASENIDRIFAPFFTTKPAGIGTGQGLAIAHSVVVEKHGGTIHVESQWGKGTTFVICLPLISDRCSGGTPNPLMAC